MSRHTRARLGVASMMGVIAGIGGEPVGRQRYAAPVEPPREIWPPAEDQIRHAEAAVANARTEGGRRKALRRLSAIRAAAGGDNG